MNDSLTLIQRLEDFATKFRMAGKGPLCVALVVTRHAKRNGLPIEADSLLADSGRQVSGLGKAAVQNILAEHGIKNVLAEEGGRTSRGSVGNMRNYIGFLNDLHQLGLSDLDVIELWWIERVKKHFLSEPFTIRIDPAKSIRTMVMDIIGQAERRQSQQPGSTLVGTVLQHLVGAKLNLILDTPVEHYGASVADQSSGRDCDFPVEDVAIHVTSAPSEALIRKCKRNLELGKNP